MAQLEERILNALNMKTSLKDLSTLFGEMEHTLSETLESVKDTHSVEVFKTACEMIDNLKKQIREALNITSSWRPAKDMDPRMAAIARETVYGFNRYLVTLDEVSGTTKELFLRESMNLIRKDD
ncbi:hypothetical protein KBC79_06825 [Candidatus Woesebacteria bacterium]|nr:hypothetical protein [Candidatus Woesebacteria bacterium]